MSQLGQGVCRSCGGKGVYGEPPRNCDECAGTGWIMEVRGSFGTGSVVSPEAAERMSRSIDANGGG
jgi:DnaJ-class molecular chaperone